MTGLALTLSLAGTASRAVAEPVLIPVPSGAKVWWLDTVQNVPGPAGVTYRYRFVMPDLAKLVPATEGPVGEELTAEDIRELDSLGLDSPVVPPDSGGMDMAPADDGGEGAGLNESELVSPEDLNLPDFRPEDFSDAEGEAAADIAAAGSARSPADEIAPLPAEPDLLLQDPVHDDIVALCETWVLPRLAEPAPLPGQVIISLADRPTAFGEIDMNAVQLFEAFSIPPDRKTCRWEAW